MTIVTAYYRGTPARPRAHLIFHVDTAEGELDLTIDESGIEFGVRTPSSGSVRISFSDEEFRAISDTVQAMHSLESPGARPDLASLPGTNVAKEVRAA